MASGLDDYDLYASGLVERGEGTREKPTEIPSAFDARIVGCICEDESLAISWSVIHKGMPRRCECGRWLKLVDYPPL